MEEEGDPCRESESIRCARAVRSGVPGGRGWLRPIPNGVRVVVGGGSSNCRGAVCSLLYTVI